MANPDILITPGQGTIGFSGTNTGTIQLRVAESGDIHFEGDQGSLLSLSDDLSDSLFSVNDAAGMPVFEVFADDTIKAYRNNESKLEIDPNNNRIRLRDNAYVSGDLYVSGAIVTNDGTSPDHISGLSGYFGKVGIGTTTHGAEEAELFIQNIGDSAANAMIESAGGRRLRLSAHDATNYIHVGSDTNHDFSLVRNDTIMLSLGASSTIIKDGGGSNQVLTVKDGKLGVMDSTPEAVLQVNGDASITGELKVDSAGIFRGEGLRDGSWHRGLEITTENSNFASLYFGGQSTTKYSAIIWTSSVDGNVSNKRGAQIFGHPTSASNTDLRFFTNDAVGSSDPTSKMIIRGNGRVGIGTTGPLALVDIASDDGTDHTDDTPDTLLRLRKTFLSSADKDSAVNFDVSRYIAGGNNRPRTRLDFVLAGDEDDTYDSREPNVNVLSIRSDSKVGIGTTSPSEELEIYSTASAPVSAIIETNQDQEASLKLKNSQGEWEIKADDGADAFRIADVGTASRFSIEKGGQVGIGGTGQLGAQLTVHGDASVTGQLAVADDTLLRNPNAAATNDVATPPHIELIGAGHNSYYGSRTLGGKIHLDTAYAAPARYNHTAGAVYSSADIVFSTQTSLTNRTTSVLDSLTEQMRIGGDGTVYVPGRLQISEAYNASPDAMFVVSGDASITGELKVSIGGAGNIVHGGGGGVAGGFTSYAAGGINAYALGMYRSVTSNNVPDIYDQQSDSVIIGAISDQPTLLVHKGIGGKAGGRVGIGDFRAVDPQAKLVVSGNASITGELRVAGNVGIGAAPGNIALHVSSSDAAVQATFTSEGTNAPSRINFASQGVGRAGIQVAGTERMQITHDGKVGIGLAASSSVTTGKLHVYQSGDSQPALLVEGSQGSLFSVEDTLTGSLMSVNDIAGLPVFEAFDDGTIVMGQYNSGDLVVTGNKVGIGTTNPGEQLHVEATAADILINSTTANQASRIRLKTTSHEYRIGTQGTADNLWIYDASNTAYRVTLDPNGNVGIGTTNPSTYLDVEFSDTTSYADGNGNSRGLDITNAATDNNTQFASLQLATLNNTNGTASLVRIHAINENSTAGASSMAFTTRSASSAISEKMRIKGDGNVGIGTTNPGTLLEIYSSAPSVSIKDGGQYATNATPHMLFKDGNGTISKIGKLNDTNTVGFDIETVSGDIRLRATSSADPELRVTSSGVGIGTTSPEAELHVFNGTAKFEGVDGNDFSLELGRSDNANTWKFNHAGADLRIYNSAGTGSDILLGVDAGGGVIANKVGIGTASPDTQLTVLAQGTTDVVANFKSPDTNAWIQLRDDTTTDTAVMVGATADDMRLRAGSNERVRITSDGKVGIGESTPEATLQVDGDASITGELKVDGNLVLVTSDQYLDNNYFVHGKETGGTNRQLIGLNSSNKVSIDGAGIDAIFGGNVGIGTASPDNTLHVHTASAGSVTPPTAADDLVVENSAACGITIISPDANDGGLYFANPSDSEAACLRWNHNADTLFLETRNAGASLVFETANTVEAMRIDSSQRVGIGTTSPGEKLHVSGNAIIANAHTSNTTVRIGGGLGTSANYGLGFYTQEGVVRNTLLIGSSNGGSCIRMTSQNSSSYEIWADSKALHFDSMNGNRDFYFNSNSSAENIVYITQGEGAVGIGVNPTSLRGSRFAVSGDASISGDLSVTRFIKHGGDDDTKIDFGSTEIDFFANNVKGISVKTTEVAINDNSADVNFRVESDDEANMLFVDGGTNRVGIGTSAPSARLQIFGDSAGTAKLQIEGEGGADPYINFLVNNTTHWAVGADDNRGDCFKISQHSAFGTNDFFTVRTDGKVGIGTDNPANFLDVDKDQQAATYVNVINSTNHANSQAGVRIDSNTSNNFLLAHADSRTLTRYGVAIGGYAELLSSAGNGLLIGTSTLNNPIIFGTQSAERMRIGGDGNVGIGTTVPSGRLHVENSNTGIIVANDQITGNAFEVFGAQGNLLTITDDLSDSLFSVNDAAGMPVFEVFANDTIKSYRNNESKFEVDPDNNRIRLRDNVNISGLTTITGGAVVGGGTRFTAGGTHELSINLGVGDCIGIGASDSALNYFRRYSAINETLQLQTYAGANNGIFSMQPYGGEVHIGMNNGTAILGSLLAVDGDAQISGQLRVGADGEGGIRIGSWQNGSNQSYGAIMHEEVAAGDADHYGLLLGPASAQDTYLNAAAGREVYIRVDNSAEYDCEFSSTGVLFNRGHLPNADFAVRGDTDGTCVFAVDAGGEFTNLQSAKLKIAGVATANKYLKCTNADGTISWEDAAGTITALNNQTANRLVTIGATTTELDGEANLTFDGTTLNIQQAKIKLGGSATASTYIKCTNTDGSVTFDTLGWDDLPAISTLSELT